MERSASGLSSKTQTSRRSSRPESTAQPRPDKANPRPRSINRSTRASDYAAFADQVRRDLNPRGPLEAVLADHVVQAAWRLRSTLDREPSRPPDDSAPAIEPPRRAAAPAADRAARAVKEALESLDTARLVCRPRDRPEPPEPARLEVATPAEHATNEWPIVPSTGDELDDPADSEPPWRDRLVFDFDVSDTSPIIKGTWITVGHVISLIVDGETWADILRSHPELTEADIRTCVAYAMAEDELAG